MQLAHWCFVNLVAENYGDLRKTALYFAVSNSDVTCAEMLLAAGAKTNLDPLQCILVAIRAERFETGTNACVCFIRHSDLMWSWLLWPFCSGMSWCSCCCPMERRWTVTSEWSATQCSPRPCSTAWKTRSCWDCCSTVDIKLTRTSGKQRVLTYLILVK